MLNHQTLLIVNVFTRVLTLQRVLQLISAVAMSLAAFVKQKHPFDWRLPLVLLWQPWISLIGYTSPLSAACQVVQSKRPLHLLVCGFYSFFFHLKASPVFFCFFLSSLCRRHRIPRLFVVIFHVVLFLAPLHRHGTVSFSYLLSLMIHTVGPTYHGFHHQSFLPFISSSVWHMRFPLPRGMEAHFTLSKKHVQRECKKLFVPLRGEISWTGVYIKHTQMQLRNEIVMERWIRFITGYLYYSLCSWPMLQRQTSRVSETDTMRWRGNKLFILKWKKSRQRFKHT